MKLPNLSLEKKLWTNGMKLVVGLDEAGRGPWAGPLSVAGVLISDISEIVQGVNDSKKLSASKREQLYTQIIKSSFSWGVSLIKAAKIDKIGVVLAVQYGMTDVVAQIERKIGQKVQYLIIDGKNTPQVRNYPCKKVNKADSIHYSVAAASIIAKVTRDRIMESYSKKYPEYGFDSHVGYGTKKHRDALEKYGVCPIHRMSYRPMKEM